MGDKIVLPTHVGIIPDGNRRWAKAKGLKTSEGHEAGFQALKTILEECRNEGASILSFYAFSTENFMRSESEVSALFGLLDRVLGSFTEELVKNKILLMVTGSRDKLDKSLLKKLDASIKRCKEKADGAFILNICLNYGSKQELVQAAKALAWKCQHGDLNSDDISEDLFEKCFTSLPPVDLLIRTSGEQRISNFMLWQCAYAEFYFAPEHWPDFSSVSFRKAIEEFKIRQRRFGT